jgi:hypothetical protein
VSVVVNKEDFEKTGWAIKKKDITKKSMIGKGEFGGKSACKGVPYSIPPPLPLLSLPTL